MDPTEQNYPDPDKVFHSVNFKLNLEENGVWRVQCPEWEFDSYSRNPIELIDSVMRDIISHNEESSVN